MGKKALGAGMQDREQLVRGFCRLFACAASGSKLAYKKKNLYIEERLMLRRSFM